MTPMPRTRDAAPSTIPRSSTPQPQFYVLIPQRLVTLLYDTPLAIGIYALVARLHQATKAPVPLSAPDLLRYDPSISRGAAIRALDRLTSSGYLLAQGTERQKRSYTPAWGRVRGMPLAWDLGAPCLGRPRHVYALRLDQRLLDTCMGKLTPHPARAATITRYLTAPLLGIADIGAYALALAGIPRTTTALERLGLISDGEVQPLMSDARLLALASQQTLSSELGAALTASGARKLGIAPILPSNTDTAQPLFFVPPTLIGSLIDPLIDPLIGHDIEGDQASSALQREEIALLPPDGRITWMNMENMNQGTPPYPPHAPDGSGSRPDRRSKKEGRPPPALPQTESARLLRSIGVLPEIIIELADTPIERVEQAIAHGRARPEVRDLAGWVVKLLRAARDYGWAIPQPRPADAGAPERAHLIDVDRYTSGAYGDLFRRGSDTSDLELLDHSIEELAQRAVGVPAPDASFEQIAPDASTPARSREADRSDVSRQNERSDGDLTQQVREQLLPSCDRQHRAVIERLRVHVAGDTTLIRYASLADCMIVQDHLLGAIRQVIADLGGPTTIRLTDQTPQGEASHRTISVTDEQRNSGPASQSSVSSVPGIVARSSLH